MEGNFEHSCSERDELRLRLHASENALEEERAKVLEFRAGAEVARALAKNWEGDNQRLREDLQALRQENQSLRERIGTLEESWSQLQERLVDQSKDPHSPPQMTLGVASSLKRPSSDDDATHSDLSRCKRLRMAADTSLRCAGDPALQYEQEEVALSIEEKDSLSGKAKFLDSLAECLSCTPVEISPAPSLPKVTTSFITSTYEATPYHTANLIPAHKNPTGDGKLERQIAWPPSDKNPLMPRFPGRSGLLYLEMHEPFPNGPLGLLYVLPRFNKAIERAAYVGEYEVRDMGQMTTDWFIAQVDSSLINYTQMKTSWAESCLITSSDYINQLRARIALRKHKVIDRGTDDGDDLKVEAEVAAVKAGGGHAIAVKDIIQAFICGDELPPIRLVQVAFSGYDHIFADDMLAKWPAYLDTIAIGTNGEVPTKKKRTRRGGRWREKGGMATVDDATEMMTGISSTSSTSLPHWTDVAPASLPGAIQADVEEAFAEGEVEDGEVEE
ncbi:hypothetical protein BKA70DRAFT_1406603 [Coprinopsis sp. MPI-PUGE-AT-0042]|nr:hypothetical protein BKA70DRAFT_1406603 [Coprinopsis sp. MPI-PUGE-AT-0042]